MLKRRTTKARGGFTLLEVLLVLAIIGVIAVMVVPTLFGTQDKAMIDTARNSIKGLEHSLELYRIAHNQLPEGGQEALNELLDPVDEDGNSTKPYLETIADPWGEDMYYEFPNNKGGRSYKPAIWSSGPNRKNEDGGGDDINNWDEK